MALYTRKQIGKMSLRELREKIQEEFSLDEGEVVLRPHRAENLSVREYLHGYYDYEAGVWFSEPQRRKKGSKRESESDNDDDDWHSSRFD